MLFQEVYWRIPGTLTPQLLQSYEHMVQQALDNTLELEPEESTVQAMGREKEESSDDEYLFDKIKAMPKRDNAVNGQGSILSCTTTVTKTPTNEEGSDTSGLPEIVEKPAVLEQAGEVEFHIQEFDLDDNESEASYGRGKEGADKNGKVSEQNDFPDTVAKGESSQKKTRYAFESDSDDEMEKRQRSVSSSDSETPLTKRARIIDSDDE